MSSRAQDSEEEVVGDYRSTIGDNGSINHKSPHQQQQKSQRQRRGKSREADPAVGDAARNQHCEDKKNDGTKRETAKRDGSGDIAVTRGEGGGGTAGGKGKKGRREWLEWKCFKIITEMSAPPPYGMAKPAPINEEEINIIARECNELFPVGFYEMTCKKRGVTKGRGEWRNKEALRLLHCTAERAGCKFKARFCRIINGMEVWTSGEHDYSTHSAPPKRGLPPDAREFVSKHHNYSQKKLVEALKERGLIENDADLDKIRQQVKRRKLTVKNNARQEKLSAVTYNAESMSMPETGPSPVFPSGSITAGGNADVSFELGDAGSILRGYDFHPYHPMLSVSTLSLPGDDVSTGNDVHKQATKCFEIDTLEEPNNVSAKSNDDRKTGCSGSAALKGGQMTKNPPWV